MDRLLATGDLYLTEHGDPTVNTGNAVIAGNIVVATTDGLSYTVNGDSYVATDPVRADNDADGYFWDVDGNDYNFNVMPAYNGGCDLDYQKCLIAPTMISATAGTKSVTVTWDTAPIVDTYKVYRATTATGTYSLVKSGLADSVNSWTNTGLTAGKRYYYKMISVVDGKVSDYSSYVTAVAK